MSPMFLEDFVFLCQIDTNNSTLLLLLLSILHLSEEPILRDDEDNVLALTNTIIAGENIPSSRTFILLYISECCHFIV